MSEATRPNRRNFIKKAALGGLITLTIPEMVAQAFTLEPPRKMGLKKNDVILFQGDSITDFYRDRKDKQANSPQALGLGYVFNTAAQLLYQYPAKNLQIYNRGVSGDKVFQLMDRWQEDCLDLKPDVLSILIGVNDFWHTLLNGYKGTVKTYRDDYKTLLDRTKQNLPEVQLILGEPFAIPGVQAVNEKWFPTFNEYRETAREIAKSFDAVWISYQKIYNEAIKSAPARYWTMDGVHPTVAGAGLMAHAWMQAVKG
ncbi:MAG: SGNH/GDSL hydrolase family protein [Chitinophagaceae bacterium]